MDSKLASYWERFAIYVTGALVAMCCYLFVEQKGKVEALETKVWVLQQEKVSKQELKELEDRFYKRMDGMKGDIIERLDWYFLDRKPSRKE